MHHTQAKLLKAESASISYMFQILKDASRTRKQLLLDMDHSIASKAVCQIEADGIKERATKMDIEARKSQAVITELKVKQDQSAEAVKSIRVRLAAACDLSWIGCAVIPYCGATGMPCCVLHVFRCCSREGGQQSV